jgi:putative ATPase
MELFPRDQLRGRSDVPASEGPLAERMRPRSLEEFRGQDHLLGPGGALGPVVEGKAPLPSLILWGPPGCGKTTLARLLAERAGLKLRALSAVQAGVKDLREMIDEAARERRAGVRTALFVDEIHRFNKAQQDALLPHVERGTVVLLGATTENPSFEVIPALRSRCPVFTLKAHDPAVIRAIVERALADPERGLGGRRAIAEDALDLLSRMGQGDARRALQLLERAAARSPGTIERDAVAAALEERVPDYDKAGDAHYDVISAFIKSVRGSDPDAAVYWLTRMLEGGEDPRFICRRMMILASEDIGNADPQGLVVATAAAEAFDRIGLPEGKLVLAQAVIYLASTAKSNASYLALVAAQDAVREHGALPVPFHLRNAPTELMRKQGYGKGYQYPHDHPEHFVREQYLPDAVRDARFYTPTDLGIEGELARRLERLWDTPEAAETPEPPSDTPKRRSRE